MIRKNNMKCNPCPNPTDICSCILHPDYRRSFKAVNLFEIVKDTASEYGITVKDLVSPSRIQETTRVRKIAMKKCRKAGATLDAIGKFFNRNHSTVLYQLNK